MRCEDYPCCGHGPAPYGDGGGCPDEEGRFNCVTCGRKLAKGASSSICERCMRTQAYLDPEERDDYDRDFDSDDTDEDDESSDEDEDFDSDIEPEYDDPMSYSDEF